MEEKDGFDSPLKRNKNRGERKKKRTKKREEKRRRRKTDLMKSWVIYLCCHF